MMEIKAHLKACPFCGSSKTQVQRDVESDYGWDDIVWYIGRCADCKATTANYRKKVDAITAWNARKDKSIQWVDDEDAGENENDED